ncbi:MAG: murein hydrolase activator EnvC family protein, partial [Methyloligellaceae bacterium]
ELVRLNGVGEPFKIKTGQTLLLPDSNTPVAQSVSLPGSTGRDSAPPPDPVRRAPPPNRTVILPPSTNIPKPAKLSGKGFLWPLTGKIISRYGRKARGLHNDGINIAAPRGTPVRAAQNGVVAYYGNELRGFGNLILIKHARGYMTAYAHADKVLVRRGQRVKRGQVIARVGSSGSVAVPQLHFEIRKGRRPVNPVRYLNRRQATAPGKGTVKRYSGRPGLGSGRTG